MEVDEVLINLDKPANVQSMSLWIDKEVFMNTALTPIQDHV